MLLRIALLISLAGPALAQQKPVETAKVKAGPPPHEVVVQQDKKLCDERVMKAFQQCLKDARNAGEEKACHAGRLAILGS